jgi:CubicO group peptidase (beta-lactamase class C family)
MADMPHLLTVLLGLCVLACGNGPDAGTTSAPSSVTPPSAETVPAQTSPTLTSVERPGGDWSMSSPHAHGFDATAVARVVETMGGLDGARALLIVHDGELIVEETFRGGRTDRPHNVKSVSKSLLGAAIGIAIDRGVLDGLDQPLAELLPDALPAGEDGRAKGRITLRHLLTQTTGLESTSGESYGAWVSSPDWVRAALARPLLDPPGKTFRYSTGNTHLLSAVLAKAAGTTTRAFVEEHLTGPVGIEIGSWSRDPQGIHLGGNEMSISPRDMARVALLALNGGRWGERQVVPREWMEDSLSRRTATTPEWQDRYGAYGYLWWIPREGEALAAGYAGQFIWLLPAEDMAVIVISDHEPKGAEWDARLFAVRDQLMAALP